MRLQEGARKLVSHYTCVSEGEQVGVYTDRSRPVLVMEAIAEASITSRGEGGHITDLSRCAWESLKVFLRAAVPENDPISLRRLRRPDLRRFPRII